MIPTGTLTRFRGLVERHRSLAVFALIYVIFWSFKSPFFTWDSFHYLSLSLKPVIGETHPLGFGYFLLLLTVIGKTLGIPAFAIHVYHLFNVACVSIMMWMMAMLVISSRIHRLLKGALLLFFALIIAPSLILISNSVWSEGFFFLTFCLIAVLVARLFETSTKAPKWLAISSLVFVALVSIEVRFQGMVLVAAVIATGVTLLVRRDFSTAKFAVVAGALSLLAYSALNASLKTVLPVKNDTQTMVSGNAWMSAQCVLRCDHPLFSEACVNDTPAWHSCSDAALGFVKIGQPISEPTFANLYKALSLKELAYWVVGAPVRYLFDVHRNWGLEVGRFQFSLDDALKTYTEDEYFRDQFELTGYPKKNFVGLVSYLEPLHFRANVFNALAGTLMLGSLFWIFKTKNAAALYCLYSALGSWALYAYFNPHTPFRFVLQMILFSVCGFCLLLPTSNSRNFARGFKT